MTGKAVFALREFTPQAEACATWVVLSVAPMTSTRIALTSNQIRGFWAAWGGWALDGMDSFIYALVLVPALRELLPRSGIAATTANIGYYGGILFALFLVGWGLALLWGPVADRFGRVRTLMLTIVCFSLFTLLSAFANNIWTLAVLRLLAGIGIGGEWGIGATLISEEWPEERRTMGAGMMHTGYYFGFFLAALANYFVGSRFGWRWMFVVGGAPALLVFLVRRGMSEPARWQAKQGAAAQRSTMRQAFLQIFSPRYRLRTVLNLMYQLVSTIGLWAGSVYVPAAITVLAVKAGHSSFQSARLASYGTGILSIGTILGALSVPGIADRLGRRVNQAIFYSLMGLAIVVTFGYVFYLQNDALKWFFVCLFFLGLGGANYTVYSFWLPEQYETECRASALAFAQNVGRFAGAGATFLVGLGVRHFQTLGIPVALTAVAFIVGLGLLPFGAETRGKPLPT
ncbi:MAG TPA: MFS transporter [Bryobacteraceae bacterium]|nr:MFS transporter [Bryobacteraceae bacterium]